MIRHSFILLILLFVLNTHSTAQGCITLGQNPSTAFPVCGTSTFMQNTVPICSSANLFVPGCSGAGSADYQNKNPFWYQFTCFQGGTLGFLVTPNNSGDDYDWQLYDITGHNPDDVYSNSSLIVTGNWAGTYGATGASASGVNYIQCASNPADNSPSFAQMPTLIQGHTYLLLISHFTDSQSGYSLSFGGGTANITDPTDPHLLSANAACDGTVLSIKLNKKMKCNSLAADGSDFIISTPISSIIAAVGNSCASGFDMDSVILTLNNPLPPGTYTITIVDGSDLNTLKDNCDREIPVGENIPVTVYPVVPTPMDSITTPGCSPQTLELVFRKNIRCNSIAANGSDFIVSGGPYPVTVIAATGDCTTGLTRKIYVQLSAPMQVAGTFRITLVTGSDGNTIIDECGQETPAGEFLFFNVKDTVSADFSTNILLGCIRDSIQYAHDGRNGVNSWKWNFDGLRTSSLQNPLILYGSFGEKNTQLIVSNGVCSDTASVQLFLGNALNAGFEATMLVCPGDQVMFKDTSTGNIINYDWTFYNGNTSILQDPPPQVYVSAPANYLVPVRLVVTNNIGCKDTAIQKITIIANCYIAVPSAFTPNGDGLNDYLYPLNAYKAVDLSFSVYNRFGQRIFYTNDWTNKWDGTFKGQGADPGTYVWVLSYTNTDTNKRVEQKGTSILIR